MISTPVHHTTATLYAACTALLAAGALLPAMAQAQTATGQAPGQAPGQAAEQAAEAPEATLSVQTVSSSRTAQNRGELAATAQVIDSAELRQQIQAGFSLKEALGHLIAGLDLGNQGRSGYGQNMRGRPMLVMIDGVSLNSSRSTSRQLDSIDPFHIERIEVLSGASSLYGGGATGGIVNIITRKAEDGGTRYSSELGATSGFAGSGDRQLRVAQSISGGNDRAKARLGIAVQDYGNFYDGQGRPVRSDIAQTDLQNTRSVDLMGNLQLALGADRSLGLTAQYYRNEFKGGRYLYAGPNFAGIFGRPQLLEQREGFTSDVMPMTERAMLNADYRAGNVLGGQDFYLQAFYRKESLDFAPYPGQYVSATRQNTDVMGLKAAFAKALGPLTLRYGLDLDRENFDSSMTIFDTALSASTGGMSNRAVGSTGRYPDYRVDGTALFTQLDWRVTPDVTLNAGLRYQRMSLGVDDFVGANQQVMMKLGQGRTADAIPGGSNSYNVGLFNLGALFKPVQGHETWLNYSEGFELPDVAKYYGMGQYQLNGTHWQLLRGTDPSSAPLQGIKTRQVEWGWRARPGRLSAQSAIFYAWSDKNLVITPGIVTVHVEDDKRRNFGWEGALDYRLGSHWTVGGSWLWMRSENQRQGQWMRQSIMTASPSKLTTHAQWNQGPWTTRLQGTYLKSLSDGEGKRLAGYTTWDLMASVKLPKGRLSLGVQNLFDKQYLTTWSQRAMALYAVPPVSPETFAYYGRGRTFTVGYHVDY